MKCERIKQQSTFLNILCNIPCDFEHVHKTKGGNIPKTFSHLNLRPKRYAIVKLKTK